MRRPYPSKTARITLLATAQAWIAARGSAAEAGRVLYCHENTVRYRMRRIEDRLGISLEDSLSHAEFAAALEAVQVFPDLATPHSDGGERAQSRRATPIKRERTRHR